VALRAKYAGLAEPEFGKSRAEGLAKKVDRLGRSSGRHLLEAPVAAP
jgi:hypothetical protein